MTDAKTHTEDWKALPWKKYRREVYRLQKRIYRASWVPMTKAHTLKSCLMGNYHGQFGSGGGAGDCPTDHNNQPNPHKVKIINSDQTRSNTLSGPTQPVGPFEYASLPLAG